MSEDVMKKLNRMRNRQEQEGFNKKYSGGSKNIFHKMQDGENNIRLVDVFCELQTHFISKSTFSTGFITSDAVEKNKVPRVINCGAWDTEKEEWKPGVMVPKQSNPDEKRFDYKKAGEYCVICAIRYVANMLSKDQEVPEEQRKDFEKTAIGAKPKPAYKWNGIDRDNPNIQVTEKEGGEPKDQLGMKIFTFGSEALGEIENIMRNAGNISDVVKGIDIVVKRGNNGTRVFYTAWGKMVDRKLVESPLTDEEKALEINDLKKICGKEADMSKVRAGLQAEYSSMLNEFWDEGEPAGSLGNVDVPDDVPELGAVASEESLRPECFGEYESDAEECKTCGCASDCQEKKK